MNTATYTKTCPIPAPRPAWTLKPKPTKKKVVRKPKEGKLFKYQIKKIATYLQRPLLWISCVLHPLSAVPPQYTKYLLYNPLTHTIEYMRICLFPNYVAPGVNLYYPAAFALCSVTFGIMAYRNNRPFLMQR